jgi:tungstate transport system ATP-binding protein
MSIMLEIRDLLVTRGGRPVLEVNHLPVEREEVMAILGPNGAGKTTLLLALARLIRHQRGDILFVDGGAAGESDLTYRRRMALVLQDPLLFDSSVFENVAIGLHFRHVHRDEVQRRVNNWLERLGIAHLQKRRGNELSGGEAQRVSLARAFVLQPELLLLDEPFAALDAPTRLHLLDDLKRLLAETFTTTIFITHDLREALQLSNRMAVILNGKLHQHGPPQDVLSNPVNEAIAEFLEAQEPVRTD